jgi:hypothetical protein
MVHGYYEVAEMGKSDISVSYQIWWSAERNVQSGSGLLTMGGSAVAEIMTIPTTGWPFFTFKTLVYICNRGWAAYKGIRQVKAWQAGDAYNQWINSWGSSYSIDM